MGIEESQGICRKTSEVRSLSPKAKLSADMEMTGKQIEALEQLRELLVWQTESIKVKIDIQGQLNKSSPRAKAIWMEEAGKLIEEIKKDSQNPKEEYDVFRLSRGVLADNTLKRLKATDSLGNPIESYPGIEADISFLTEAQSSFEVKVGKCRDKLKDIYGKDVRKNIDLLISEVIGDIIKSNKISPSMLAKIRLDQIDWKNPSSVLIENIEKDRGQALKTSCQALDKMIASANSKAEVPTNQGPTPPPTVEHILSYGISFTPTYIHTFKTGEEDLNSIQLEGRASLALKVDPELRFQLDYFGFTNFEDIEHMNDGTELDSEGKISDDGIDAERGRDAWALSAEYQDWRFQGTFLMENNVAANRDQQRYLGAGGFGYQFRLGEQNEWGLYPFGGVMGGAAATSAEDSTSEGLLGGYAGGRVANQDLKLWEGTPTMGFSAQAVYSNLYNFVSGDDENQVGGMGTIYFSPIATVPANDDILVGSSDLKIGLEVGGGYNFLSKTGALNLGLFLELSGDTLTPQPVIPGGAF